eukprot:scaffold235444_cov15-Tisochrysis_lutea.AAC.1
MTAGQSEAEKPKANGNHADSQSQDNKSNLTGADKEGAFVCECGSGCGYHPRSSVQFRDSGRFPLCIPGRL